MKKKYFVIPALFLILSLISTYVLVYWLSPYTYGVHSMSIYNSAEERDVEQNQGFFEHLEAVYRLCPNESTLNSLVTAYNPFTYYSHRKPPTEDFYQKSALFKEIELENAKTAGINVGIGPYQALNIDVAWYVFSQDNYIIYVDTQYITSLYLAGETEKAKKEMDNAIALFKQSKEEDVQPYLFRLPFEYLYAHAQNEADRAWVVEKETEITDWVKQNHTLSEENMKKDNLFSDCNRTLEQWQKESEGM